MNQYITDELSSIGRATLYVQPRRRFVGRVIRCRQARRSPSEEVLCPVKSSRYEIILSTRSRVKKEEARGEVSGPGRDEWGAVVKSDLGAVWPEGASSSRDKLWLAPFRPTLTGTLRSGRLSSPFSANQSARHHVLEPSILNEGP